MHQSHSLLGGVAEVLSGRHDKELARKNVTEEIAKEKGIRQT